MIYPRTNVLERRKDVTRLLVRGYTPSEIAKGIGVSRETVYNDVRYIRSGRNEDLSEYGRKQMLAQVMLNARERVKELWSVVEKSESPYVKLLALRELRIHDQQTLNHIFLFTQIGEDKSIKGSTEDKVDAENVSNTCPRVQPTPASDDLETNRHGRNDKEECLKRSIVHDGAIMHDRKSEDKKRNVDSLFHKGSIFAARFRFAKSELPKSAGSSFKDPAVSVKTCRKSLAHKGNELQMALPEMSEKMYNLPERKSKLFREIEHTSETGFIAEAGTLNELFAEAGKALTDVMTDVTKVEPKIKREVELEADSLSDLMHIWLEELNYLSQTEHEFYSAFKVEVTDNCLKAIIRGEAIDLKKHEQRSEVKAVTYGEYKLEKTGEEWLTRVIIDI